MPPALTTVLLLVASNVFMTYAWYYHLKKPWPLLLAILLSWGMAFFEYCLQVPANRIGSAALGGPFTTPQLKIMQEAITLVVFSVFSVTVLQEKLRPNDYVAFGLIFAAVVVSMWGRGGAAH